MLSDNITSQIRPCGIFPVSFLYAPLEILLQLQGKHLEVIFVPDAVIPHMWSRLNALSERIQLNRLAKVIADDLAVLSIHSAVSLNETDMLQESARSNCPAPLTHIS